MKKLLITALCLIALQKPAQNLTTNLVICMPMDGNANDYSTNGNNGVLMPSVPLGPSPTMNRFNVAGMAYSFNANNGQYIDVPFSSSIGNIENNDELAICVWARVTAFGVPAGNNLMPLIEKYQSSSDDCWAFSLFDAANSITPVDIGFGSHYQTATPQLYEASNPITPGWHFYVANYSASQGMCTLYVDGIQIYTAPLTTPGTLLNTGNSSLRIGFSQAGPDEYAHGDMDDLRIYNRTLTAAEVLALMTDSTITCATTTFTPPPPPPSGCCLGNICGQTQNALVNSYEIPQNAFNFNFTTPRGQRSQVLIGRTSCATTTARLDVFDDVHGKGIKGYSSLSGNHIGVHGEANDPGTSNGIASIGVLGQTAAHQQFNRAAAVAGFCGGTPNYGLMPLGEDIAIYGNAKSNNGVYAGYFDGNVVINGIAAPFSNPNMPLQPAQMYALTVRGNAITTAGAWYLSDRRFKDNIKQIDNVMEKVMRLTGYNYTYKTADFREKNFNEGNQIGLIAQELQEVFPELVRKTEGDYLAVNYQGMIPVLLEAIKTQQVQLEKQQLQINELKSLLSANIQTPSGAGLGTGSAVTLSDQNVIVLEQNVPNPFAENTTISYNLPSGFSKAQIIFSNTGGTVIKTVDIREAGPGKLNVFASDLSNGLYTYSLVVDGKVIDSKKMVKE